MSDLIKRIISDTIAPHFKRNDYAGGLSAGVSAMIAAANAATQASGRDRSVIGQCVSGSNRAVKWRSTAGACVMR